MLHLTQQKIEPKAIDWTGLDKRFMNKGELEVLCTLIGSVKPKTMIEFGINTGRTAKALLREVPSIERYIGVDVLPGYQTAMQVQRKEVPAIAGEHVEDDPRVQLIVKKRGSHDLDVNDLPAADAIFIDGDHSRAGVEKDTYLAQSVIRAGGIIVWHDYHDLGKVDVREVLHEFRDAGCEIIHATGTWLAFTRT